MTTQIFQYKAITRPPIAVPLDISVVQWQPQTNQPQHVQPSSGRSESVFQKPLGVPLRISDLQWLQPTNQPQHVQPRKERDSHWEFAPPIALDLGGPAAIISDLQWQPNTNQPQHVQPRKGLSESFFTKPISVPIRVSRLAWLPNTTQPQHVQPRKGLNQYTTGPPVGSNAVNLPRFAWWQPTSQPHQIPPPKERAERAEFRPLFAPTIPSIISALQWVQPTSQPHQLPRLKGVEQFFRRPERGIITTIISALFDESGIEETYEYSIVNIEPTQLFGADVNL